jgi:hypothetical protein
MNGNTDNATFVEFALCDCDWDELVRTADEAGLRAAREAAQQCRPRELGRPGRAWVRIEPMTSPVASWLHQHGHARCSTDGTAVLVPMRVRPEDLGDVEDAAAKAASVLTGRAYADAYCAVLAEEAGVTATPEIEPDRMARGTNAPNVPAQSAPTHALPAQSAHARAVRGQAAPAPRSALAQSASSAHSALAPPEQSTSDTSA